MKKLIPVFLLVCLIAPLTGAFIYLQYQKQQVKKSIKGEMMASVDKRELVHLKFSKEEAESKLRWEHSTEFEYCSKMYDVVQKEVTKDSVLYICWWDFEETDLNRKLNTLVAEYFMNNPDQNENSDLIIEFYKNLYCSNTVLHSFNLHEVIKSYQFSYLCAIPNLLKYSPPSPPPEFYS